VNKKQFSSLFVQIPVAATGSGGGGATFFILACVACLNSPLSFFSFLMNSERGTALECRG
jgi:hypothetical protein